MIYQKNFKDTKVPKKRIKSILNNVNSGVVRVA